MIDLLSRIPNAQKATSYGWKNKCARRERIVSSVRANPLFRPTKIMVSRFDV
jgi:hypothetical protein